MQKVYTSIYYVCPHFAGASLISQWKLLSLLLVNYLNKYWYIMFPLPTSSPLKIKLSEEDSGLAEKGEVSSFVDFNE